MKRMLLTLVLVLVALPAIGQMNPNWEYYRTMRWKAKPGQAQNFMKAAAKKTQMFNNTPETSIVTYRIRTGPDQGKFERVTPFTDLGHIYSSNPKEMDYWSKNVSEYVEEPDGAKIWWRIKGWSVNWEPGTTPSKYMEVQVLMIKNGHTADFRRIMNRRMQMLKEHSTRKVAVFKISSGSQLTEFRVITFFDDPMTARGEWKTEDFDYEDAYNERHGYNARDTDNKIFGNSIEMYGNIVETHELVPEMSFMGN
ncbi:MAG: hypothetical protein P8X60_00285 [Robiginitalea sp.]